MAARIGKGKGKIDHKAALAFEEWVQKEADSVVLECRVGRHRWPGLLSKRNKITYEKRTGRIRIEAPCERGCGVGAVRMLGSDGILEHSKLVLDYSGSSRYLLPTQARTGHGLSREQRGFMRLELLTRRAEQS